MNMNEKFGSQPLRLTKPVTFLGELNGSDKPLDQIRDRLVDLNLVFILAVGLPGLISSLFRARETGWQPVMTAQIVLYLLAIVLSIFRKRVSFYIRAAIIIGSFFVLAIVGLWSFGLAGVSVLTLAIVCLQTAVLLGTRSAFIALIGSLALMGVAAYGAITGATTYSFDANLYIVSPTAWIFAIVSLFVLSGLSVIGVSAAQAHLQSMLQASDLRYKALFEEAGDAIVVCNLAGHILDVNQLICDQLGYTRAELLSMRITDLTTPEMAEQSRRQFAKLKDKGNVTYEAVYKNRNGRVFPVELNATLIDYGTETAVLGIIRDVTERQRLENELRKSEAQYRSVIDDLPGLVCSFSFDGNITFVNDAYCQYYGKKREDLIGHNFIQFLPDSEKEAVLANIKSLTPDNPQITHEHQVIVPEGELRWQRWTNRAIFNEQGDLQIYQSIGIDITKQKQDQTELNQHRQNLEDLVAERTAELTKANEMLRYSQERLSLAIGGSGGALWDEHIDPELPFDEQQGETYYSPEAANILGYIDNKALAPTYQAWLNHIHPEDRALVDKQQRDHFEGRTAYLDHQYRVQLNDESVRWIHGRSRILRDKNGRPLRWIGIDWDVTERKQAELKLSERTAEIQQRVGEMEQLNHGMLNLLADLQAVNENVSRTAQQLEETNEELESFAYSVSHDLRAPLRHISGFSSLLQKREYNRLDEKSKRYLKVINEAAGKMGQLIDDLLEFSRTGRQGMTLRPVNMNNLVEDVKQQLMWEIESRKISWALETLPSVNADQALLRQVWVNLLGNAVKYTRKQAEAHIEIGTIRTDQNDEVAFYVRDNGVGFDDRFSDKLFGVFQRLHRDEEFEGNGIGLATIRRIIHKHNGRVWAEGKLNQGATFYFSLPSGDNV